MPHLTALHTLLQLLKQQIFQLRVDVKGAWHVHAWHKPWLDYVLHIADLLYVSTFLQGHVEVCSAERWC
jgi:hypothetical protein